MTSATLVHTHGSTPNCLHSSSLSTEAAAASFTWSRATSVTLALRLTRAFARARPMPEEPPVMRTWSPAKDERRGILGESVLLLLE